MLVRQAQEVFLPVWEDTKGDDGYVSFELDPLLEDVNQQASDRGADDAATSSWASNGAAGTRTA